MRMQACSFPEALAGLAERRRQLRERPASFEGRDELRKIDTALGRLHSGHYGNCVRCGYPIEPPRLRAVPYIECCAGCA